MKNLKSVLLFSLIFSTILFFPQGIIIPENFDELNKKINTIKTQVTRSKLDSKHTLEKYLHYTHYQEGSSCAAHAITTCRTILYARDNDIKDINEISLESFSPYYTYLSCKSEGPNAGMNIADFENINSKGFIKIKDFEYPNYFPFSKKTITNCSSLSEIKKRAVNYKFSNILRIDEEDSSKEKIDAIKQELSLDNPAIVSFYWNEEIGFPERSKNEFGHAVTLIGYDDNRDGGSFLFFNSHGDDYGDNGKDWITYKKFFKCQRLIYFLYTNEKVDFSNNTMKNTDDINVKASRTKNIEENKPLSFNWAIRMPIINNLGTYNGDTNSLGEKDGNGEFKADNSATYKGAWKDDAPYGNGTAELNEELKYSANWDNNFELPNIYESIFNYSDGTKYEGGFKGKLDPKNFHGFGIKYYPNGNIKYEGEWKNGVKNGKGSYYYGNGPKYVGEWLNNKRNGQGIMYRKDGSIYQNGIFENDKFVK